MTRATLWQLRHPRPAACAEMGATQHREIRRRQEQRHHRRPVRRRRRHRPRNGVAVIRGPIPSRDLPKLLPRVLTGRFRHWPQPRRRASPMSVAAGCGSGTDASTAKCLRKLTSAQVEALAGTESAASQYVVGPMLDGTVIPDAADRGVQGRSFQPCAFDERNVEDERTLASPLRNISLGRRACRRPRRNIWTTSIQATPRRLIRPGRRRRFWLTIRSAPTRARNWLGIGSGQIRHMRRTDIDKILLLRYRSTPMSSTTRLRRPTSRKCRGSCRLAYHTSDIQYLFPLWHGGPAPPAYHSLNKKQTDLSDQLVAAWTNFAWTGNPNGLGNYPWPRYTNGRSSRHG